MQLLGMANARLICGPFPGLALPSKGSLIFVIIVYALTIGRAWPSAAPCHAGFMHVQCARRPCTTLAQALPRPLPVGRDRCGPRHGGRKSFAGPPVCLVDQPYILLTKRPLCRLWAHPVGRFGRATFALLLALRCSSPPSPSDSPLGHAKCGSAQDAGARVGSEQVAPLAARGSLGASRWSDVGRQSCDARVQRRAPARTSAPL